MVHIEMKRRRKTVHIKEQKKAPLAQLLLYHGSDASNEKV